MKNKIDASAQVCVRVQLNYSVDENADTGLVFNLVNMTIGSNLRDLEIFSTDIRRQNGTDFCHVEIRRASF